MKKQLFILTLIAAFMLNVDFINAQCTPNPLVTDPEGDGAYSPDTIIASAGITMNATLSIICPDTVNSGSGIMTPIYIKIKNFANKPSWLTYTCSPSNCQYIAGQLQCVSFTGTPPIGLHDTINMDLIADVYILIGGFQVAGWLDANLKTISLVIGSDCYPPNLGIDRILCDSISTILDVGAGYSNIAWWPTGAITPSIVVSNNGTYIVTATDLQGCVGKDTINVKFYQNPPFLGSDLSFCLGNSVVLDPGNNYSSYLWYPSGSIDSVITVNTSGIYTVNVTDISTGCPDTDSIVINVLQPVYQDIELVTIDTSNGNNRITWNETLNSSADSVKIYREYTSNNYMLVGEAPYSSGSWTDTVDSRNQNWRYKISLVDTCGNEGIKSHYVQNVHCWVTPNIPSGFNMQWTPYEIEGNPSSVSQYNLYSGNQLGQLQYITFVSGSITEYTFSTFTDSLYVVGAVPNYKGANDDALSNWVSQSDIAGINVNSIEYCKIFPNPANNILRILTSESEFEVKIFDVIGQVLYIKKNLHYIDISNLKAGTYILRVKLRDRFKQEKLIVY